MTHSHSPINHGIILAWLRSSVYLSLLSVLLFGASLLLFIHNEGSGSMLLALLLWLLAQYHGYRLFLDWALWPQLPTTPNPETELAFDQALATSLGRPLPTQPRSQHQRWQGCRQLLQRLGYCLGGQVLCLAWQLL